MKVGDEVLPGYGGTKIVLDKNYILFREGDILVKYAE